MQDSMPIRIKELVLERIKENISGYTDPLDTVELYENKYLYLVDEDELTREILNLYTNRALIRKIEKTINFSYPYTVTQDNGVVAVGIALGGKSQLLLDIFDDFIRWACRMLAAEAEIDAKFETLWNSFENDFLADEVEVTFITQLATFYYQAGGILNELVPNVKIQYLHQDNNENRAKRALIKQALDSSYRPPDPKEFLDHIPVVAEFKVKLRKDDKIAERYVEARKLFEKICFLLRTVCGGSAHFDFVLPVCIGNFSSEHLFMQIYHSNHLFTNATEGTTMENGPYETWFRRAWVGMQDRDIDEWQFAILKTRDAHARLKRNDFNVFYDKEYKFSRCLEKNIDLIQALENILGDFGRFNGEYVSKLINSPNDAHRRDVKKKIEGLYKIRDKYLHGQPTGRDSLESTFQSVFNSRIEELESALQSLEYYLSQIILLSVMNEDFKEKMRNYHTSKGRPILRIERIPANPQQFPTLNTVYY